MSEPSSLHWFLKGVARARCIPALVLMAAFLGFSGIARDSGVTLGQAVFMTATVWALPSMLVLVGAIKAGLALPAAAIGVALSALRLMPMTMALVPMLRAPGTRRATLVFAAHFVAITAWVMAFIELPKIPRAGRAAYFLGFAVTMTAVNMAVTAIGYVMAGALPPALAAGLTLLTPLNFTLALWGGAKMPSDRLALLFGVVLTPVVHAVAPQWTLVVVGLVGGGAAYWLGRRLRNPVAGPGAEVGE